MKEKIKNDSFAIVAISLLNTLQSADNYMKTTFKGEDAPFPVLYKGRRVQREYKGRGTPNTFILDSSGYVRFKHFSFSKGLGETFELEVTHLLDEMITTDK
jgi:hypothetical protein